MEGKSNRYRRIKNFKDFCCILKKYWDWIMQDGQGSIIAEFKKLKGGDTELLIKIESSKRCFIEDSES